MKAAPTLFTAALALLAESATTSCVELQGIVANPGPGLLDLSVLKDTLGNPLAPLDIANNPVIPTVSQGVDAPAQSPLRGFEARLERPSVCTKCRPAVVF